ncbi:hypothetical protein BKA69DRAFT_1124764 [Paraphysoderma sedebokerense]|nr:hypothetical protein BKA69DRAFT_1124764 [Paraphysoderma sedebokerense]
MVTLDNVIHTPKKISNFPFRHADSQLAIVKGVYFKKGDENYYSSAASSLAVGAGKGHGKGHFNWTNAITLDSLASTLSTDSSVTVEDVPDSNPQESVAHVCVPNKWYFC